MTSGKVALETGEHHNFELPLANLMPIGNSIRVRVFDEDMIRDDCMADFNFDAPYQHAEKNYGNYYVKVRMT